MKYIYMFFILMLLSCEGETYVEYNKSVTAVFTYPINSTESTFIELKTLDITDLAAFLANSANGGLPNQITTINIQKINLQIKINSQNTATSMDVKTLVGNIPCEGGQIENLTPFTLDDNVPLSANLGGVISFNIPIAIPVPINPAGVNAANNIIATVLPARSDRVNYWAQNCGSLAVYVNGKVNPPLATASLNIDVYVTFNIIYGNCEEDPFYNALAPGGTCEF